MTFKHTGRRRIGRMVTATASCVMLWFFAQSLFVHPGRELFDLCKEPVDFLLGEYKNLVSNKVTLEKEKYIEVTKLKEELKAMEKKLNKDVEMCTAKKENLEKEVLSLKNVYKKQEIEAAGLRVERERDTNITLTVVRALQQAEQRVRQLERQLAAVTNTTL